MTQISGKIYQMKNAAGTENRFPRTVIEAVYGLSSYLQQQFASLADIYMPIEGISEALTGQEFVYRISPNTIKAKSLTLDRILGRTLAWNQLMPDLSNVSVSINRSATYTKSGNALNISFDAQMYSGVYFTPVSFISGHKYLLAVTFSGTNNILFGIDGGTMIQISATTKTRKALIFSPSSSGGYTISTYNALTTSGTAVCSDYHVIDLTLLYGSAISGLTDAQILAKFESEYPGYYPYNAGELKSNDASALETTGFNLWDEETELGGVNSSGEKTSSSTALRSKNYIPLLPNTEYFINTGKWTRLCCYDVNKNFLGTATYSASGVGYLVTTLPGTAYGLIGFTNNYGTSYNHDICINLSDASRNGQYEPYWKRTLPLNLDNIKVKSHNIWDEEWEVGTFDNYGQKTDGTTTIRSKNYIPVSSGSQIYFLGTPAAMFAYDKNKVLVSSSLTSTAVTGGYIITIPSNASYIMFRMTTTYGTTYNHDICINVSSSFNGQYEPHGILTFNGVKSAGSIYDEIVGNKYVKRVGRHYLGDETFTRASYDSSFYFFHTPYISNRKAGSTKIICSKYAYTTQGNGGRGGLTDKSLSSYNISDSNIVCFRDDSYTDASNFKTSMYGHYIDYELATPIEYELVEPLVPTVKAGTTEARISPNADGLSAPFRADITYSAQENNDSASSQYAAVAGRLLNPQTIWGQTFDGSSPVTGALTGVTTINGTAIQINSSGNVGIGTAATTAKLKVNGEIDCGGITCGGEAIFTDGIELDSTASYKIWYDDEYNRIVFTVPNGDYLYSTGGIISASYITAGASSSSSDARLKDNIASVSSDKALSIFSALSGKEWDWNDKMTAFEGQHCSGLVAQEVQKVIPWAVLDYNDTLSLNYNCLWGIAIPVIQNLMHRVEELESKLNN